jgi:hypothetical protein
MHSLNSTLYGGEWSASCHGRFIPRERVPFTHWIGGWVGPNSHSGRCGEEKNSHALPGIEPLIIQPVAQRYTTELSRLLLAHLVNKKKRLFYGIQWFITESTRSRCWGLPRIRCYQSTSHFFEINFNIILPSTTAS